MCDRITHIEPTFNEKILSFDLGIKNLAFCLIEAAREKKEKCRIIAWNNVDLSQGGESTQKSRRCGCGGPPSWIRVTSSEIFCKTCVRRKKVPLPILPCKTDAKSLQKFMKDSDTLKDLPNPKRPKKIEMENTLHKTHLFPYKPPKIKSFSLEQVLQSMDHWLDSMLPIFSQATLIKLENQPVHKGPTMKSVQIMLFTLLEHRLRRELKWTGKIVFVHAKVKTDGVGGYEETVNIEDEKKMLEGEKEIPEIPEKMDAYRARKKAAEVAVEEILKKSLEEGNVDMNVWKSFYESQTKKNDLADCFLMSYFS